MIDPSKYSYKILVNDANGAQYDITSYAVKPTWEELEDELSSRMTFECKNDTETVGAISEIAAPGCWISFQYNYNGGGFSEAICGKIVEWNPKTTNNGKTFKVKAYDCLYDLQESHDYVYFKKGTKTKKAITKTLSKWGVGIASYDGPNVSHPKMVYSNERLGTAIIKILKEARKKGGSDAVLRASKTSVSVVRYGSNGTIYCFSEAENLTEVNHKISTAGMVTRVRIYGKKNKSGNARVKATVNGDTEFGVRQKIIVQGNKDKIKALKQEAKQTLADEGVADENITVTLPDIPIIKKGDQVYLDTETVGADYYIVVAITHNIASGLMTCTVKPSDRFILDESGGGFKKGDIATFSGGTYYAGSSKKAKKKSAKSGKVKVTKVKSSAAHPYRVKTRNFKKTKISGWVNASQLS